MNYASNRVAFQRLPIGALRPYGQTLRRHSKKQLEQLHKAVAYFGQVTPILVSPDFEIIDGHAICEALKANGESDILVGIVNHLTPAQIRGLRLQLNRSALDAGWDQANLRVEFEQLLDLSFDLEVTGFSAHEVELSLNFEIPSTNRRKRDRAVPQLDERPVCRPGDIFQLGDHRLGCGDGRDRIFVDRVLAGAKSAACFFEPSFGEPGGEASEARLFDFFCDALDVLKRASTPDVVIFAFTNKRYVLKVTAAARHLALDLLDVCVWAHNKGYDGSLYREQLQLIPVFALDSPPQCRRSNQRSNLWKYSAASNRRHPSNSPFKPVALFSDAIRDATTRGDAVLATFCQSDSLIIAAEKTGRRCCAIDNHPRHVDLAIRRWQRLTGGEAVLNETGERFSDRSLTMSPRLEHRDGR